MYYKNKENKPYFEPSQEIISRDGLEEITEEEFNQIVLDINTPTAEQELQSKIQEAKSFLDSTQFKFGDDYDKKDTLEWLELKVKRQEAREFIRNNK